MKIHRKRFVLLTVLLAAGCSTKPTSPPYDAKQAQATLVLALDAWKQENTRELARRKPPIRFEDDDCRNGLRLTGYSIEKGKPSAGPFDDLQVTLSLLDRHGNKIEKSAAYQITLEPRLSVLRND
jgi:hypothetical protein